MSLIVTFTDFGLKEPYTAQMEAAIYREAPTVKVIHQLSDAPKFNPFLSGFLLAACVKHYPKNSVFLSVVDPGVGTEQRAPVVVNAGGYCFVGPGNGLFDAVVNQSSSPAKQYEIVWKPKKLSNSFHGRDLFAPVAARLANKGELPDGWVKEGELYKPVNFKKDINRVVYIDDYGNVMLGLRAKGLSPKTSMVIGGEEVVNAKTFGEIKKGRAFWYENSMGLLEIAVNQGSASEKYNLNVGDEISIN